jgi:hypothetical protein
MNLATPKVEAKHELFVQQTGLSLYKPLSKVACDQDQNHHCFDFSLTLLYYLGAT